MPLIRLLRALAALLVLATAMMLAELTGTALQDLRRTGLLLETIERLRQALVVAEMASRERGPANGMLGDEVPHRPQHVQALAEARQRTDKAFAELQAEPQGAATERSLRAAAAQAALARARDKVDKLAAVPKSLRSPAEISAAVHEMVAVIPRLAPVIGGLAKESLTYYPPVSDDVQAARLVAELREYAGLLGSHFTAALASGQPLTRQEHFEVSHTQGRIDELRFLVAARIENSPGSNAVAQSWAVAQERYFGRARKLAERIIADSDGGVGYGMDPAQFAAAYVPDMNTIQAVRDALLEHARAQALAARSAAERTLAAIVIGAALLLATLLGAIALVQRRILAPLSVVAKAVDALARNRLEVRLPVAVADDEVAAVIGAAELLRERTRQRLALERERDALIEQLRRQSNTDALTGLPNRRGFIEAAEQLLAQAARHEFGVAVILLDIDHFKRFNDELGHAAGDAVLVEVGRVIRQEMRASDLAGRLGGEEFVLLLGHCDLARGFAFAERLRAAIESISLPASGSPGQAPLSTTASLGVAMSTAQSATLERLLSRADAAMYLAKAGGRNRVMSAEAG
jgi:diguanylate cyclase (GGDEF)-like protein